MAEQAVAPTRQPVVLVSGLSGAGKASVLRALEDIGFEAVDNPPLDFIEDLVCGADGGVRRIAVGVDARSRGFDAEAVLATLARLRLNPMLRPELIFAWADEAVLLRRFTETRRRHPLAPQGRVSDGIAAEQQLTAPLHGAADLVIDTSDLPLASLRQLIERKYGPDAPDDPQVGLSVSLVSFAFPAGLPREADIVLDARFLRNPHYDPLLRPRTGYDVEVAAYVEADPDFPAFFARVTGLLDLVLPRFVQEGKKYATIAVGCTGGRHRSVMIVERLASHLSESGWRVSSTHRELARDGSLARAAYRRATGSGATGTGDRPGQAQEA
ncbi:RNase adapter RapZ [Limobrevibacterium gyesilva]|uniref:RNase adapter RapZ n=1 Tax=Limobrevibacterium gyesilva TaxID=2991712 RepID=A0AA42CGB1_9PROT|nr:RNase adapter RapZ [Limobrevibacterium gyesilva]MCW3473660.1 RNase adapter RapZ [Limobrevibacterium gyesilva]